MKDYFPTMEDILQLRTNPEVWEYVARKFLVILLPTGVHSAKRLRTCFMQDLTTTNDEAFMLLIIENNYGRWMQEAKKKASIVSEDAEKVKRKYTAEGNEGSKGWSQAGRKRFGELHSEVLGDRETDRNNQYAVERNLMNVYRSMPKTSSTIVMRTETYPMPTESLF